VRRASIFADKLRCDGRSPSRGPERAIVGEWISVCTIPSLAKVGVEGSNPFARSKILAKYQIFASGRLRALSGFWLCSTPVQHRSRTLLARRPLNVLFAYDTMGVVLAHTSLERYAGVIDRFGQPLAAPLMSPKCALHNFNLPAIS